MRQIGTIPPSTDPALFLDHLLALGITSRAQATDRGAAVWVHDENRVAEARAALDHYLGHPDDPRYHDARAAAEAARLEQERLDRAYRKNFRKVGTGWDLPNVRRKPLTSAILGVCIALFALETFVPGFKIWSMTYLGFAAPEDFGRVVEPGQGLRAILRGEVWRIFTPALLHANLIHIAFNLWFFSAIGPLIEARKGTAFLAVLVVVSAAVSDVSQYLYMINFPPYIIRPFVGLSGVLYALFGYVWMKGRFEPEEGMIFHPSTVRTMLFWLLIGFVGILPIANGAHVGGLIVGVLFGLARL